MSTSFLTVPNLSGFTTAQVADWYFLTQIGATDSASSGTAMSTGYKTDDGNIAWLPGDPNTGGRDDGGLTTIAETLRADKDFAIGVASTVPFNHATPAAFVSHNVSRNNYAPGRLDSDNPMPDGYRSNIAEEILLDVKPDVVIGGGYDTSYVAELDFSTLPDDYVQVFRSPNEDGGQSLTDAAASVNLTEGDKLFGLFGASESDSGYSSDGNFEYFTPAADPSNPSMTRANATYSVTSNGIESDDGIDPDPTLKETALATLGVLSQDPDGFFVMFEQGFIDWANHDNNFANMIGGVADLDAAVRAAEDFVEREGDGINWSNTLMLVTADHSNSYMRNQVELGKGELPTQVPAGGTSPYGSTWAYPNGEVTYRSDGHTDEMVTLQARGAGAELFANHAAYEGIDNVVDNTSIYQVMMDAAESGVKHIILFIGDGMNISHEVAGSRYLYGVDDGLAWHDWGTDEVTDSWAGYTTTWDVTTYNDYASANGQPPYAPATFDPSVGYNPALGGAYPSQEESNVMQAVGSPNSTVNLVGKNSDDVIIGSTDNDTLAGEMGNDIIVGGDGNDLLWGDRNSRDPGGTVGGDDLLYGGKDNDRLGGKAGNDQLFGEDGNDLLWGDDGDDLLWGGKGYDVLTGDNQSGGKGSDIFVLGVGEGTDAIVDFQVGIDKIGLYGDISFGQLTLTDNQLEFGDEVLAILSGVNTANLGAADFIPVMFS